MRDRDSEAVPTVKRGNLEMTESRVQCGLELSQEFPAWPNLGLTEGLHN